MIGRRPSALSKCHAFMAPKTCVTSPTGSMSVAVARNVIHRSPASRNDAVASRKWNSAVRPTTTPPELRAARRDEVSAPPWISPLASGPRCPSNTSHAAAYHDPLERLAATDAVHHVHRQPRQLRGTWGDEYLQSVQRGVSVLRPRERLDLEPGGGQLRA